MVSGLEGFNFPYGVLIYPVRLYGDVVLNNPILTLQLGILGKLLGLMGRIVKGCVREVSLAQVSCILMYICVCGSAHTSGCVVDGLGATAAF